MGDPIDDIIQETKPKPVDPIDAIIAESRPAKPLGAQLAQASGASTIQQFGMDPAKARSREEQIAQYKTENMQDTAPTDFELWSWHLKKTRPELSRLQIRQLAMNPSDEPLANAVEAVGNNPASKGIANTMGDFFGAIDKGASEVLRPVLMPLRAALDAKAEQRERDLKYLKETTPESQRAEDAANGGSFKRAWEDFGPFRMEDPAIAQANRDKLWAATKEGFRDWDPFGFATPPQKDEPSTPEEQLKAAANQSAADTRIALDDEKVPTPSMAGAVSDVVPKLTHAYDFITGGDGKNFDKDANLTARAPFELADLLIENHVLSKLPPYSWMTANAPEAQQRLQSARSQAVHDLALGDVSTDAVAKQFYEKTGRLPEGFEKGDWGKSMSPEAAEAFARPSLGARVATGDAVLQFGPKWMNLQQSIPKQLAPIIKALDPIINAVTRTHLFGAEDPRSVKQLTEKAHETAAKADVLEFHRAEIKPLLDDMLKKGVTANDATALSDLQEAMSPEGFQRGDGSFVPLPFADRLSAFPEDVVREIAPEYSEGATHFEPQVRRALEHLSTLPLEKQAQFMGFKERLAELPKKIREFTASKSRGRRVFETPRLNGDILDLPPKIFDIVDRIKELDDALPEGTEGVKYTSGYKEPAPLANASPRLKELFTKAVKGKGITAFEADAILSELRNETPKVPEVERPNFVRDPVTDKWVVNDAPLPPEPPRDASVIAQELQDNRLKRQEAATHKAEGTRPPANPGSPLTREELGQLREAMYENMKPAMKQYNAVATYRPGQINSLTRAEVNNGANPNLQRAGAPMMSTEDMQRGMKVADQGRSFSDLGDVKATVAESEAANAKGTAATHGEATGPSAYDRFLTKVGLSKFREWRSEIQKGGGKSFYEPNALKAMEHQLLTTIYKTMSNQGVERAALSMFDVVPADVVNAVRQMWWNGVETGATAETTRAFSRWKKGRGSIDQNEPSTRGQGYDAKNLPPWETVQKPVVAQKGRFIDPQDPFAPRPDPFAANPLQRMLNEAERAKTGETRVPGKWTNEPPEAWKHSYLNDLDDESLAHFATGTDDFADSARRLQAERAAGSAQPGLIRYSKTENKAGYPKAPGTPPPPIDPFTENPLGTPQPGRGVTAVENGAPRAAPQQFSDTLKEKLTRHVTLEDVEELWRKSGRKDSFFDNLNLEAQKALNEGKPLQDVMTRSWQPAGRDYMEWNPEQKGYIHSKVFNDVTEYRRLGNDPTAIGRWMRLNMPIYHWYNSLQKKLSTIYSMPAYILGNIGGDIIRSSMANGFDGASLGEIARGYKAHLDYHNSGAVNFPEYDFGAAGKLKGEAAAKLLERSGVLEGTLSAGEFQGAETKTIVGKAGEKIQNVMRAAETNNRAATFAKFMRDGNTPFEAAFKTNQIYFDFSRSGPWSQVLSETGIMPFARWHAKIIPYMLNWALTKPGQFALTLNALKKLGAGSLPTSQLPPQLQGKLNIPYGVNLDEDQKKQLSVIQVPNDAPGEDFMSLVRNIDQRGALGGSWNWVQAHLGPPLKLAIAMANQQKQMTKDPLAKTEGEQWETPLQAVIGRPARTYREFTDPKKQTWGARLNILFNPGSVETFDPDKQAQISVRTAKDSLLGARLARGDAAHALAKAKRAFMDAHKDWAEADAVKMSDADPDVMKAQKVLDDAAQKVRNHEQQLKQRGEDVRKVQRTTERLKLAP